MSTNYYDLLADFHNSLNRRRFVGATGGISPRYKEFIEALTHMESTHVIAGSAESLLRHMAKGLTRILDKAAYDQIMDMPHNRYRSDSIINYRIALGDIAYLVCLIESHQTESYERYLALLLRKYMMETEEDIKTVAKLWESGSNSNSVFPEIRQTTEIKGLGIRVLGRET